MILGISIIRWVLIILSVFIILEIISKFLKRQSRQTLFKLFSSLSIWSTVLLISIYPDFAYFIARKLGMGENLNTLIFFGFVVSFMLIFKIISIIENIEQQITEIIRKTAIKEEIKKANFSKNKIKNHNKNY